MAFSCRSRGDHGFLVQPVESPASAEDRITREGIADGVSSTERERPPGAPAGTRRGDRNRCLVDPALDGLREFVEFGKDRTERPADSGVAAVRAARPPCLYGQGAHERHGRPLDGAVAAKEAFNDRLSGQSFGHRRPKGLVSFSISPQVGQVTRQGFRQCFGTAPDNPPARADPRTLDIFAAPCPGRSIQRIAPARRRTSSR